MGEKICVSFSNNQLEVKVRVGNPPRKETIVFDGTKSAIPDLSAVWWEKPSALPKIVSRLEEEQTAHAPTSRESGLIVDFTTQTQEIIDAGKAWPAEG